MLQNNTTTGQHRPETPKVWAESPTFAHWPQLNRPLCIHWAGAAGIPLLRLVCSETPRLVGGSGGASTQCHLIPVQHSTAESAVLRCISDYPLDRQMRRLAEGPRDLGASMGLARSSHTVSPLGPEKLRRPGGFLEGWSALTQREQRFHLQCSVELRALESMFSD